MRMRLHLDRKDDGIVVLESESQMRSLFIYSQTKSMMRVPLPYILFTVRYVKQEDGKFLYPGIYGSGLHVYGKLKPLTDVSEEVFYLPTDSHNYQGLVCTDHYSDNKKFDTVVELVDYVITLWWGLTHYLDYEPFNDAWDQVKLDDISNGKWETAGGFNEALLRKKVFGLPVQRKIPKGAKLVDVQWPATFKDKAVKDKAVKAVKDKAVKAVKDKAVKAVKAVKDKAVKEKAVKEMGQL